MVGLREVKALDFRRNMRPDALHKLRGDRGVENQKAELTRLHSVAHQHPALLLELHCLSHFAEREARIRPRGVLVLPLGTGVYQILDVSVA
jgi:hypothetical protein